MHDVDIGTQVLIGFRPSVRVLVDGGRGLVDTGRTVVEVRPLDASVHDALQRLMRGPVVSADVLGALDGEQRARLGAVLGRLRHVLDRTLRVGGRDLARFEPTARHHRATPATLRDDTRVRLSPFALCRARDGHLALESPLAMTRVVLLHRDARALVAELGTESTVGELADPGAAVLVAHLAGEGLVEVCEPDGAGFVSDRDPVLQQWEFHDLLFHFRTRMGRHDGDLGGMYPHRGRIDPQPAERPVPDGPRTVLRRPSRADVAAQDVDLTTALEGRRSVRTHGEHPVTLDQLAQFLYRVQRTQVRFTAGEAGPLISRPYPAGGSSYEIEFWVTVGRCAGIAPGIYYYDPAGHALVLVNDVAGDRSAMLTVASLSTREPAPPDILVTLTSRFQRLSWKYRGIAYGITLRHTGVIYQTMYLVATAMRLAPCGLGLGDVELVARVLGLDPLREGSVGDFALGSLPPQEPLSAVATTEWEAVNDAGWADVADRRLRGVEDPMTYVSERPGNRPGDVPQN